MPRIARRPRFSVITTLVCGIAVLALSRCLTHLAFCGGSGATFRSSELLQSRSSLAASVDQRLRLRPSGSPPSPIARRAGDAGVLSEQRLSTLRSAWAAGIGFALALGVGLGFGLPDVLQAIGSDNGLLAGFLRLNFFVPVLLGGAGALEHWLHGANMALALIAMGGIGSYVGWQIRQARIAGEPTADITAPFGIRHEIIMGLMTLVFTAGGVGGLLFTLYEGRPLFDSPHGVLAVVALLLLYAQGALGFAMKQNESLRSAHSIMGSATMGALGLLMTYGIFLGLTTN
mmetsp:Transcript_38979/g.104120  ORF Transcript_38979/g.104120 Transcript_38979/m.104120 type:complete len:288 (+) Transcript_38979:77-940(+)